MIEFTSFCLFLMGMISCAQGQRFSISTKFMNGKLTFKWSNISSIPNDIIITKDSLSTDWIQVYDDQYTVEDVLQYKSVTITVREYRDYNPFSFFRDFVNYNKTYNVKTIESTEGESRNISWTAEYFPKSGHYFIFHEYNGSVSTIIRIGNSIPPQTEKYVYYTRPYDSVNIRFEVRNITVKDAGYYLGGGTETDALSGDREGVVLIVSGKPLKPIITGDLNVKVRTNAYLKCESRSTSGPYYYKKFPPLSYSWFVNNARVEGEDRETYSFIVSKEDKYNRYSCQTKEILESDRSEEIRINPLYGPESVIITPQLPNSLSIHDGDLFGPYSCSADCNPPCTLQWKYKNPSGGFSEGTPIGNSSVTLPAQTANRTSMASIRCVVNGTEGRKVLEIGLNIQYFLNPKAIINGRPRNTATINEGNALILSCLVEGNPTPEVTLRKLTGDQIIKQSVENWLNYTLIRESQCSDTSTYSCEGKSTEFGSKTQLFHVNVLCDPRLDESMLFKTNYGSTSGPDVKVGVSLPIVANPSPSTSGFAWSGPTTRKISTKVSQRDNIIYKHWINSTIPIPDQKSFGNYSLKYNGKVIVHITINDEDASRRLLSNKADKDRSSRRGVRGFHMMNARLRLPRKNYLVL